MSKFIELKSEQGPGSNRRWFSSGEIDLIVWTDETGSVAAIEFYYDKNVDEHVLIWRKGSGFTHLAVDDGEQRPVLEYKQSPMLIPDGSFDPARIRGLFEDSCQDLPADVTNAVRLKLEQLTNER